MKYNTIKEATEAFIREMDAIPMSLIQKAYTNDLEEISYLSTVKECGHCGSEIEGNEKECSNCGSDEEEFHNRYDLPMWGTVWTVNSLDEDWIKENLDIMSECGFWVYETDELGVFIGINGAGYDFYEAHWIPLYKARGLKWHKEEN